MLTTLEFAPVRLMFVADLIQGQPVVPQLGKSLEGGREDGRLPRRAERSLAAGGRGLSRFVVVTNQRCRSS
jgi:hypothetical protein